MLTSALLIPTWKQICCDHESAIGMMFLSSIVIHSLEPHPHPGPSFVLLVPWHIQVLAVPQACPMLSVLWIFVCAGSVCTSQTVLPLLDSGGPSLRSQPRHHCLLEVCSNCLHPWADALAFLSSSVSVVSILTVTPNPILLEFIACLLVPFSSFFASVSPSLPLSTSDFDDSASPPHPHFTHSWLQVPLLHVWESSLLLTHPFSINISHVVGTRMSSLTT